jgi:1-acyl-sn-glycerol-3-phosphate acyltransferase
VSGTSRRRGPRRRSRKEREPSGTIGKYRPSALEIEAARLLLAPWRFVTAPKFYDLENVPTDRPVLLVGNHSLMGVLDVPLMGLGLHEQRGVFVRSLADHAHFQVPLWRDLLVMFGAVEGTRANCRALMQAGESILVFPGGGREVFKRKGEKYRLVWKQRIGFAQLAIEQGYPIVPFSAVGADDCYEIVADGDDLLRSPLGPLIERWNPRPDILPPLLHGVGLSPVPYPQRFYFRFGTLIETAEWRGSETDAAVCFALRERVRTVIETGIDFLLHEREKDPGRDLFSRLGKGVAN